MEGNKATAIATSATASFGYGAPCSHSIIFSNRATPILQTALPCACFLRSLGPYQYSSSFVTTYHDEEDQLEALDFGKALSEAMPRQLSIFGLRAFSENSRISIAHNKLVHLSENEAVLEAKTKLFKVNISVYLRRPKRAGGQKNLVLSYTITYQNKIGQLYIAISRKLFQTRMLLLLTQLAKHTIPAPQLLPSTQDSVLLTAV